MNIRASLFMLFGVVAVSAVMAADPSKPTSDAQTQAAGLLKAELVPPLSLRRVSSPIHVADNGIRASAQMQAANLLQSNQMPASAASRVAYASVRHGKTGTAPLEKLGAESVDAQTQAQQILRGTNQQSGKPRELRVLAAFH
jgi:hypothetical protein